MYTVISVIFKKSNVKVIKLFVISIEMQWAYTALNIEERLYILNPTEKSQIDESNYKI